MKLGQNQRIALDAALKDAFHRRGQLARLTVHGLGETLEEIAGGETLPEVRLALISWAESHDRIDDLLLGALRENSTNLLLRQVVRQFALLPRFPTELGSGEGRRLQLERIIDASKSYLEPHAFLARLRAATATVCRVEIRGVAQGTAFLVGPDLLLTNHHVLEPVIDGRLGPETVTFRFDFHLLGDGRTANPGVEYHLAKDWLIDTSPASAADDDRAGTSVPDEDELDHALVRLATPVGALPVGEGGSATGAAPRGFSSAAASLRPLAPGGALHVLQHPLGDHLKLSLASDGVIGINANGTRVRYRTNTESGSSGSPCFDETWSLVALHQAGDPNFDADRSRAYNQGVPMSALLARWARLGISTPSGPSP